MEHIKIKKNNFLLVLKILSFLFCLFSFSSQARIFPNLIFTKIHLGAEQIVQPAGFPPIGKWMLNEDFKPADWLRHKYRKKLMHEPINILIIDSKSISPEEAAEHLIDSCKAAGFSSKSGHSFDYKGYIGGDFYRQMPSGIGKAFSDERFTTNNNHGRIFGPYLFNGKYYFTASLSREDFVISFHYFDSFIKARDDFSEKMNENTDYHFAGKINLENAISSDDPKLTTGDHDGQAVIIVRK
jgi:hypothetical protein